MQTATIRVFVSSTWLDLQPERKGVEQELHRLRETKFVGMEYFGSKNETTRAVSLEEVYCCDLYIGIFAGCYGSGITEQEYRLARKRGLDCLIYFKDDAAISKEQRETDKDKADRLIALKQDLRCDHTISVFRTPEDLAARVGADVHNWLADKKHGLLSSLFRSYSVAGITSLAKGYDLRVENFIAEYLGSEQHPVPFGGRDTDLALLNDWLLSPDEPAYMFLGGPAGRGKSA